MAEPKKACGHEVGYRCCCQPRQEDSDTDCVKEMTRPVGMRLAQGFHRESSGASD